MTVIRPRATDLNRPDDPHAEITRVGRWTYHIRIVDGIGEHARSDGWATWGRRRAEKKARRILAQYRRQQDEKRDVTIITDRPATTKGPAA